MSKKLEEMNKKIADKGYMDPEVMSEFAQEIDRLTEEYMSKYPEDMRKKINELSNLDRKLELARTIHFVIIFLIVGCLGCWGNVHGLFLFPATPFGSLGIASIIIGLQVIGLLAGCTAHIIYKVRLQYKRSEKIIDDKWDSELIKYGE